MMGLALAALAGLKSYLRPIALPIDGRKRIRCNPKIRYAKTCIYARPSAEIGEQYGGRLP